jgi:uncharacterized RDD family membrane protein YckC
MGTSCVNKGEIGVKNELRYAGLWQRFLALLTDFLLFCACFFPITRLVKGVWLMSPNDHRWVRGWFISDPLCLVFLAIMVLYFVLLEGLAGATLGKWLLGLRVVRVDGSRPDLWKSALRNALRLVDSLPTLNILGAILISRSAERARFGDRVAGTRVIRIR